MRRSQRGTAAATSTSTTTTTPTTGLRRYMKSDHPRLRWTPELHDQFIKAIEQLGGIHNATPKRILEKMKVDGIRISHIKSHLQTYRSRSTIKDCNNLHLLILPWQEGGEEDGLHYSPQDHYLSDSQAFPSEGRTTDTGCCYDWLQRTEQASDVEMEEAESPNEDGNGEMTVSENCELSLSFNSSATAQGGVGEDDKEPSWSLGVDDRTVHFGSSATQSFESNYLNLNLNI